MRKGLGIVFMLTLVVVLASVAVYFVEDITTPIIEERQAKEIEEALKEVYPAIEGSGYTVEASERDFSDTPITGAQEIYDGETMVAIVYTVTFRGFSSDITYVVGVDLTGTITGYKTISQNDTAGYGAQIADAENWAQFEGMLLEAAGSGSFDGLSGASITTGSWKQSFADVTAYHTDKDDPVFTPLTDEEKLVIRAKGMLDGTYTVTPYTPTGVKTLEEFEIEYAFVANDGTNDKYIIYVDTFAGYQGNNQIMVAVDLETNLVVKHEAIYSEDTEEPLYGYAIMESDRWTQFEGKSQDDLFEGNFDGLSGATATTTGWENSLQAISIFHQAEFMGNIVYTQAELEDIYKDQLVTAEYAELEDVIAQKVQNVYITNVFDATDSLGNVVGTVYYANMFGAKTATGMPTVVRVLIGIDENDQFTGVRVITSDDAALNTAFVVTDPTEFDNPTYVLDEVVGVAIDSDVALEPVTGLELQIANLEALLEEVGTYHVEKYPLRDDYVPSDMAAIETAFPTLPDGAEYKSIYGDYDFQNGILNIYEYYEAGNEANVYGYIYLGTYLGYNDSDTGSPEVIRYAISVDTDGVTQGITIFEGTQSWHQAYPYSESPTAGTVFATSEWLDNFVGVNVQAYVDAYTPVVDTNFGESTLVDSVAGVSTTTGGTGDRFGLIDSVYVLFKFHVDNSVGGAS